MESLRPVLERRESRMRRNAPFCGTRPRIRRFGAWGSPSTLDSPATLADSRSWAPACYHESVPGRVDAGNRAVSRDDRELGMDRPITRRDFVHGMTALGVASLLGEGVSAEAGPATARVGGQADYPPLRTGLRGSHPGSYEIAHELGRGGRHDWGTPHASEAEVYDLVVVGAGISGLAAATFFLEANPKARVLILDNHDDFGGHAKRNEFRLAGRTVLSHGGSQTLQEPSLYSGATQGLLRKLGVEMERFEEYFHHDLYRKHGLESSIYFDHRAYGSERLVRYPVLDYEQFLPLAPSRLTASQAVAQMPLQEQARAELLRLLETRGNRLADVPVGEQEALLWRMSYREFLERYLGITDPQVFDLLQGLTTDSCTSIEQGSAFGLMTYVGLPGIEATGLSGREVLAEPYIHHFPDGNASIARLLVRRLISGVAPGSSMEDVVTARFDYGLLDQPASRVRLRLSSTAVRVEHEGSPKNAEHVAVTYVRGGRAYRARARACVLAGYNRMIRHLCPELPETQREALAHSVKAPLVYTNVLLRDWKAWKQLSIGLVAAPASIERDATRSSRSRGSTSSARPGDSWLESSPREASIRLATSRPSP